jgi:hypothetical protein
LERIVGEKSQKIFKKHNFWKEEKSSHICEMETWFPKRDKNEKMFPYDEDFDKKWKQKGNKLRRFDEDLTKI